MADALRRGCPRAGRAITLLGCGENWKKNSIEIDSGQAANTISASMEKYFKDTNSDEYHY
jgi:hypothetical protein